jgi:D-alanine-D-alanine ligase
MRVAIAFSDQRGDPDTDLHATVAQLALAIERLGHVALAVPLGMNVHAFWLALQDARPEMIWNLCEEASGRPGRELHAAALLELMDVPVTGTAAAELALCLDKSRARVLLAAAGATVPDAVRIGVGQAIPQHLPLPAIVKPTSQDGSAGIDAQSVVESHAEAASAVSRLHAQGLGDALVEAFIPGRELNALLLGPPGGPICHMALGEIDFSAVAPGQPQILTWAAKWQEDSAEFLTTPVVYPADVDAALRGRIALLASRAYAALGLAGYARLDLRVDAHGEPYIIDVNPNPDLAPGAGVSRALPALGLTFDDFIALQLQWARTK